MRIDRRDRRLQADRHVALLGRGGQRQHGGEERHGKTMEHAAHGEFSGGDAGHDTVGDMDAAGRFEALLAAGKDNALLRFSLGSHYLKAGDAPRAVTHLREAVRQDPRYSAAWKLLGKALAETGARDEAMAAY